MTRKLYYLVIIVMSLLALSVFTGCPTPGVTIEGEVTGGGGIYRDDGSRATFTVNGSSCGGTQSGHFNFIDKGPAAVTTFGKNGVMADGDLTGISQCTAAGGCLDPTISPDPCPQGGYVLTFEYRNKNSKVPGDGGVGGACVVDNGEGRNAPGPDFGAIGFQTGAYAGYQTQGDFNGNVQGHFCD